MIGNEAIEQDGRLADIEQWLLARSRSRSARQEYTSIDPDLDLIDSGLLDSLHLVEFAFILGKATGRRPDLAELRLSQFRTLRLIGESLAGDDA
jgi:acyl carrier protein